MKCNKKYLVAFAFVACVIVLRIYFQQNDTNNTDIRDGNLKTRKAGIIFANTGFTKVLSDHKVPQKGVESLTKVFNNSFEIDPNVLIYLEKSIPADNSKAVYAAVRYAQIQEQLYNATDASTAVKAAVSQNIPLTCLANFLGLTQAKAIQQTLDNLRQSTTNGMSQMNQVESYLAYKLIGPNLTVNQMKILCQQGDY